MERRDNVKRFIIHFNAEKSIDIDLLEQQLHSLYKYDNINLDEKSFYNDLNNCNLRATTFNLAKKSFIKAISMALDQYGISLENFDIFSIDSYSSYDIRMIFDKGFYGRLLRKEIREGVDNFTEKRMNFLQRACRVPLAAASYTPKNFFLNKGKLTKSSAYKKMLDDLMTWEKDIVERLVMQLRSDCIG